MVTVFMSRTWNRTDRRYNSATRHLNNVIQRGLAVPEAVTYDYNRFFKLILCGTALCRFPYKESATRPVVTS